MTDSIAFSGLTFRRRKDFVSRSRAPAGGSPPSLLSLNYSQGDVAGGGAPIVITGSGFTGVTGPGGVTFLGTNATSYTVDSDSQITAVLPSHAAGVGDVIVTHPTLGASNALSFEYWSLASLTMQLVLLADGTSAYDSATGTFVDSSGNSRDFDNGAYGIPAEALVNGHTTPDFSGASNEGLARSTGNSLDTYINVDRNFAAALFKVDSFTSNSGTSYSNTALFNDDGGYFGIFTLGSGASGYVRYYQWDGSEKYAESAITTNTWYLAVGWFDGSNLNLLINSVATTPAASGNVQSVGAGTLIVGQCYQGPSFGVHDGLLPLLTVTDQAYGASEAEKILNFCRQRFALSLT